MRGLKPSHGPKLFRWKKDPGWVFISGDGWNVGHWKVRIEIFGGGNLHVYPIEDENGVVWWKIMGVNMEGTTLSKAKNLALRMTQDRVMQLLEEVHQ